MFEQSSARDGGSNTCPCPYDCDAHSSTQRVRAIAILFCLFVMCLYICGGGLGRNVAHLQTQKGVVCWVAGWDADRKHGTHFYLLFFLEMATPGCDNDIKKKQVTWVA